MSVPPPMREPYGQPPANKGTNWWLIGCGGCLGLVIICAVIAGLITYGVMKKIKASPVYLEAVQKVQQSEQVQQRLGTPITAGSYALGSMQETDQQGVSGFFFPVTGPKGGAKVTYAATKEGGVWQILNFSVVIERTGEIIELVKPVLRPGAPPPATPAPEAPPEPALAQ